MNTNLTSNKRILEYIQQEVLQKQKELKGTKLVIAIAGAGCIGKTTIAEQLEEYFEDVELIQLDGYMLERKEAYKIKPKMTGYDPLRNEINKIHEELSCLIYYDKSFNLLEYDRSTHERKRARLITPKQVIILDGVHSMNEKLSGLSNFKIFIDATKKVQYETRLRREIMEFDSTVEQVKERMELYYPDYTKYIMPSKNIADYVFDVDSDYKLSKKKILFGPFIGEFGWEITYWHGWVRKMCRTKYKSYIKIACSFPGHQSLYPDIDSFIALPAWIVEKKPSSKAYITENWEKFEKNMNICISQIKKYFITDINFIIPWKRFESNKPTLKTQYFEKLQSSEKTIELLDKKIGDGYKLVTIFPRYRQTKRTDRNWGKENYEILIKLLLNEFPDIKIALVGTPNMSYFNKGVPYSCIDLINISDKYRTEYEIAALNRSELSLGCMSGAMLFALISGCSSFIWGYGAAYKRFKKEENPLKTPVIFFPFMNASPREVFKYVRFLLKNRQFFERPWLLETKKFLKLVVLKFTPEFIITSQYLAKIKRQITRNDIQY